MALKCREELVGKRFLSVRSLTKLKVSKIGDWEWRSGVIRAVSPTCRDTTSTELTVLVEFDDRDWQKREWIKVHEVFQVFLVEHTLVWAERQDPGKPRNQVTWPALCYKSYVDKVGLTSGRKKPVEYLLDRSVGFVEEKEYSFYQEGEETKKELALQYGDGDVQKAVKSWVDYQDGQRILLTTPTVLVGYRVEVYRAEGTTQWYTAVIQSYNHTTKTLAVTDDTVLEEHNEDPAYTQMHLIDDGVVDSILRGVEIGITPRRRPRHTHNNNKEHQQAHFTRRQPPSNPTTPTNTPVIRPVISGGRNSKTRQRHTSGSSTPGEQEKVLEKAPVKTKQPVSKERKRKSEDQAEEIKRSASPGKRQKNTNEADKPESPVPESTESVKDKVKVPSEEDCVKESRVLKLKPRRSKDSVGITCVNKPTNSIPKDNNQHKNSTKTDLPVKVKDTVSKPKNSENRKLKSEKIRLAAVSDSSESNEVRKETVSDNPVVNAGENESKSTDTVKINHLLSSDGKPKQQEAVVDDNMHFKKQLLISSGQNHQPSLANIDLQRPLTDQVTKLAKAENISLNGDGKSSSEINRNSEAATSMAEISSEKSDKMETKPQALSPDRSRDSFTSSVQSHFNAIAPRSNTTTPATEDRSDSRERSDSRASDERYYSGYHEEKRPSSRLDDLRSLKNSPASSPLIVLGNEPVHPYRDPELMRKNPVQSNVLAHPKTMTQPTYQSVHNPVPAPIPGIPVSSSSLSSHPISHTLLTSLPYHHQLSSLNPISHPLPLPHSYPRELDAFTARGIVAQQQQQQLAAMHQLQNAHLMQLPYSHRRVSQLELLWQQKFPSVPIPPPWALAKHQEELIGEATREMERERMERERVELERIERERIERVERDRRDRERKEQRDRLEKAEREKAERERQEREKQHELERLEKERERQDRLERERREHSRLLREQEQRQERERILHESSDALAAVDKHFTESLRLASQRAPGSAWPLPSITRGTGIPKPEPQTRSGLHPLHLVTDKSHDTRKEEDIIIKRESERERERHHHQEMAARQQMDEKRYIQSQHDAYKQMIADAHQKSESKDSKVDTSRSPNDSKNMYGYPYPYPGGSFPPDKHRTIFNLYGYPSQPHPSIITPEQLQQHGLAPTGKHIKDEKQDPKTFPAPAHSGHVLSQSPRSKEIQMAHQHPKEKHSSVIVENKSSVKSESPHYGSPAPMSSSPRPQPRPAHTPEHRPDRPVSSSSSPAGIPHGMFPHAVSTTGGSMFHQTHPTAFRPPESSRSQSPYKSTSQQSHQQQQQQQHHQSSLLSQPVDYCKSSSSSSAKLKSAGASPAHIPSPSNNHPAPSSTTAGHHPGQSAAAYPAIAQPPVSLPPSTLSFTYSLIQQGLVPNPIYSHGPSQSAAKPATVQITRTPTPSAIVHTQSSVPSPMMSVSPPSSQSNPPTGQKRKLHRDNNGRKRTRGQESSLSPNSLSPKVTVPVTTPQILTNPSPYTTTTTTTTPKSGIPSVTTPATTGSTTSSSSSSSAAAVTALLSNPFSKNSGFMDSFRSFVESTVTSVFQQEEKKNPVGDNNRTINSHKTAAESEKVTVPAEVKVEKMEVTTTPPPAPPSLPPPPSTVNEDTSSSVVTTCSNVSSNIASSYMDTINRVANGQMDTDSDTLSAPSPPPQSKSDASPLNKSGSHPKNLKKAWLQRHSDEDKEMKSVPVAGEGNPSKDVENNVLKESMDSSNSESCAGSPSAVLPNGNITDLGKQDDESTSSASETETVCTESAQPKKRVKTKKTNVGAKKLKTEEPANNSRKKTANKRKEKETKEAKTKEIKKEEEVVTKKAEEKPKIPSTKPSRERESVSPPPPSNTKQQQQQQVQQQQQQQEEESPSQQPKQTEPTEQPVKEKKKNRRSKEPSKDSQDGKNGSSFNKPLVRHSVATLKRTCQPFVQDASCAEITPKLMKCRECKMTPTQRSKKLPNIFCRFYAFRRLRYSPKGVVTISGFSELSDAEMDDIEPWLSRTPVQEPALDIETSKFIITRVGDKFCELVEQERETKALAGTNGKGKSKIAWKRAVTGVREMCDVCDTTLFNMHWVCHKCGFVVCLDCYKVKVRGSKEDGKKAIEDHRWLTCSANRQPHDAEKLMLTQIIPSDALWELGKLIHEIRAKWAIPAKCPCGQVTDGKISGKNGLNQQILNNLSGKKALVNGLGEEPHHGKKTKKQSHHSSNEVSVNGKGTYNPDIASSPLSLLADVASMDSESSRDRSDSPFSKRKSDQQEKKAASEPPAESNDPNDKKMPASCSTLRELLTKTAGKVKVQNDGNKTKSKAKSSGNTLDDIIQSVVEKSCRDIDNTQPFKFMHYTPRLGGWTRDLPIMVHNLTETSVLYPDVPHSWLCDGRLLRLHDPRHKGNFKIFQEQWKRGQPVLVSGVSKNLDSALWHPKSFGNDFGHQENDLVNCRTGNVIIGHQMGEFWDGFERISCRPQDENDDPMLLKLKDWPPGDDFSELLPRHYQDLMQGLPLPEYTDRQGKLNLASRLPDFLVRPDLGPKMYNAYGSASFPSEGTTNLHLDISDAVNVMVYVGIPSGGDGGKEVHEAAAVKAIDDAGCDSITKRRVREVNEVPGALWQIYDAHDADKIRDFLNKVAKERGETIEPDHDPIHDQSWYLDEELRERVYKEYGVQGYTIVQCMGDAIFIPAGAPHQVRNLHSCIKVAEDFVSPEHLNHCFRLTQEFRQLSDTHSNHEDKLQVKNIIYHAVKDAIAVLRDTDPDEDD